MTEVPHSEVTATLEILDRFGVTRDDLRKFRGAVPEVQKHTAQIFKNADICVAISSTRAARPTFSVWKTITIGGKSKDQLLAELQAAGDSVSDWAKSIMSTSAFTILPEARAINLARVRVADLGFAKQPTTAEIWARITELGHELCSAEVGPHLRLQYRNQKRNDYFCVATEQVAHYDGSSREFFCVKRGDDGGRWLDATWAPRNHRWSLESLVVFIL